MSLGHQKPVYTSPAEREKCEPQKGEDKGQSIPVVLKDESADEMETGWVELISGGAVRFKVRYYIDAFVFA